MTRSPGCWRRTPTRRPCSALARSPAPDTLDAGEGFQPTYALAGETVALATSPSAVEAFLDRRGPRLESTRAFRAAVPDVPPRIESLGFVDVRQLLALGEQTGLTAEDLRPVHAAGAVIEREEDDTTAELFFEIP